MVDSFLSVAALGTWQIVLTFVLFVLGLFLILKGGDFLVDGAIWIAKVTGIPEMIIGATIVSVATTLPEITVSTLAILKGVATGDQALLAEFAGLSIGNAVGSMMSNVCLSLAIVIMAKKIITGTKAFNIKALYLIGVTAALIIFTLGDNTITVIEGIMLLVAFVGFLIINVLEALHCSRHPKPMAVIDDIAIDDGAESTIASPTEKVKLENPILMIGSFVLGAVCIFLGGKLLVDKGEIIARDILGIPMQVVGITVIAIGTGLPEMVTSIKSLKKNKSNLGMGNIIGANIINATLLLGLVSTIAGNGLVLDDISRMVGLPVLMGITLILLVPTIIKKRTYKWQGALMMGIYIIFLICNVIAVL